MATTSELSNSRSWRVPQPRNPAAIASFASAAKVEPLVAEILLRRGYTPQSATRFLHPGLSDTHDPKLMKGMVAAREEVIRHVVAGNRILVFGDYDADGITGAALLQSWLATNGAKVSAMIPMRQDGYGFSLTRARMIAALPPDKRPALVITVDLGTSDHEAVKYLMDSGISVVVTDHHLVLRGLPPTPFFINPSRGDEDYPFKGLSGCGVAYKLVQAMSTRAHEPALYDLVMMATIGDQVPLIGENRYMVKAALQILHRQATGNFGLRALANTANIHLDHITSEQIGWSIDPRINAVGRMGKDPEMAVTLLTTPHMSEANAIAAQMNKLNRERQTLTDELTERAFQIVGSTPDPLIVVYIPDCGVGVAGLIASRVVEEYGHPTLVVNAEGRGSGRATDSSTGGHMMEYMIQLHHMGVFGGVRRDKNGEPVTPDYGGHSGACGFRNVDVQQLISCAKNVVVEKDEAAGVARVEAVMPLASITPRIIRDLEILEPFGISNQKPIIMVPNLTVSEQSTTKDGKTLNLTLIDESSGATTRARWFRHGHLVGKIPHRVEMLGIPSFGWVDTQPELLITSLRPIR